MRAATPPFLLRAPWWPALALLLAVTVAIAIGAWRAARDPLISWLAREGSAEWIVYPLPVDAKGRAAVELPAMFRRTFGVGDVPRGAVLRLRAFRKAEVELNGIPVRLSPGATWKDVASADVAGLLRPGENTLAVVVRNDAGPPALWLELGGDPPLVVSDAGWDASLAGAAWRSAALASDPDRGTRYDPVKVAPRPLHALRTQASTVVAFAFVSVLVLLVGRAVVGRGAGRRHERDRALAVAFVALSLVLVARLASGATALPLDTGFDARGHLEYVEYVQSKRALPLAGQGWQMFQPPLYYVLAASALALTGQDVTSSAAPVVLRTLGLTIALVNVALVTLLLRRAAPHSSPARVAGLVVAAALPPMLTLQLYPTNEPLASAASSAVVLATWVLLERDELDFKRCAALGGLLGVALLAKFSTLVVVAATLGTLVLHAARGPRGDRARRIKGIGVVAMTAVLVSGWHFGRVWARFGEPFVGGWDARQGAPWWLDPGYRTAEHFSGFGRVFESPLLAGASSLWDGLYSTAWGDGLLSGARSMSYVWWSPPLHSAGLLLAVVPASLVALGLVATIRRWVTTGDAREGFLVVLPALTLVALGLMTLRVPAVGQDKAFYGLFALAPLGAFAARGVELLERVRPGLRSLALVALGTWALTAVATFWVVPSSPRVQTLQAQERARSGDLRGAAGMLRATGGDDWQLRVALARLVFASDGASEEMAALLAPGSVAPARADRYHWIAVLHQARGDRAAAEIASLRASAVDPDDPEPYVFRARVSGHAGEVEAAIAAWREVLRIEPQHREAHVELARLWASAGGRAEAEFHAGLARRPAR